MKKILLVEDNNFFCSIYKNKLIKAGFEVTIATDGIEALSILTDFVPDLIILDLVMPNKDGFEVLADLRSSDSHKNIPVIVLSALSQIEDIEKAKNLGANDYFDKSSTDFSTLNNKIVSLLSL